MLSGCWLTEDHFITNFLYKMLRKASYREQVRGVIWAKGRHLWACGTAAKPFSMLALEMLSYAPMPSMDRMVLVGCSSVIADKEWTTASVPALVDKADWKGLHAVWKCVEKVCASVRETTLRSKSPTTNPRTPPCGFCKATMWPKPMAGTIWGGTLAVARRLHTSAKRAVVS